MKAHQRRDPNRRRYTKLADWQGVICDAPSTQMRDGARGTHAGVRRHYLYKQPLCDDCKRVERDYIAYRYSKQQKYKQDKILRKYAWLRANTKNTC